MKKLLCLLFAICLIGSITGCGGNPQVNTSQSQPTASTTENTSDNEQSSDSTSESTSTTEPADDRGISGMKSFQTRMILNSAFGIPLADKTEDDQSVSTYCAVHYTSNNFYEENGVTVLCDYSISVDNDDEIVGASFGINAITASKTELALAADLFFYAVGLTSYDTSDTETLTAWLEENIFTVGIEETGVSIVIGDARFELYGLPGTSYWLDISKAE